MPQSEGMTPLAPQFASGAAFTSQFEQIRGPGGQVLNLPRIADEGPHWQSAGATSAPLAPLPPMGLAPLPADFDQVMQMQVGSEREQVSVPRDEGRTSCVYAHRRDMEEVAVRMTNEPFGGPRTAAAPPCAAGPAAAAGRSPCAAVVHPAPLAARPLGRLFDESSRRRRSERGLRRTAHDDAARTGLLAGANS